MPGRRHTCVPAATERLCPKRTGGGLVFRKPKRTVPLPPELVPVLKAHRRRQREGRLAAANAWEDNDLVYCRPNVRPIDPRNGWKDILAAAGVRDSPMHDGRHTAGTLLIEQSVHVRTVQEILGHSDIRLTQQYTHVATPRAQDGMQRMGRAPGGRRDHGNCNTNCNRDGEGRPPDSGERPGHIPSRLSESNR
ncbi:tyrosine-type recombinase/integrase [Actinomadura formosensis]|uniref:tyrosine-type recombinase/integrase n=1 Tax=Actinomadura formosensis TaxID=60706 RepID=UPI003D942EBF